MSLVWLKSVLEPPSTFEIYNTIFMEFLLEGVLIEKLRAKLALITMPIDTLSLKILNALGSHVGYIFSIELCHGILLTCC